VLVTAEIIAKVYYAALREASTSRILRRLCGQILSDEVRHVEFQTEQLAKLRRGRAAPLLWVTRALHQLLFVGATLIVTWSHRSVLSRAGCGFRRFCGACLSEFAADVGTRSRDEGTFHVGPMARVRSSMICVFGNRRKTSGEILIFAKRSPLPRITYSRSSNPRST